MNAKNKSNSRQSIIIEGVNQDNVLNCFEYLLKLKENAKIKYYDPAYSSLIKNKFDEIKDQFKSMDIIINSPKNGKTKISLFATCAANNSKKTVENYFKSFDLNKNL